MIEANKIYEGDCIEGMKSLPDKSVNCCVTSPPYFGLRDYGQDGQIGLEETPEAFVAKMVDVFREVKRVLRDDGTLWLNLGDSYAGSGKGSNPDGTTHIASFNSLQKSNHGTLIGRTKPQKAHEIGLKPKDLIGIPWMVAFALRADGWYLRQDIIWHKPNPMPESVTDRCTKSHEYIFLLSKSKQYYYDHEAIRVVSITPIDTKSSQSFKADNGKARINYGQNEDNWEPDGFANKRSVWTVTTKPFKGAHFATYPEDLIVDCIKAGCPEGGIVLDPFMGAGTTALVARKLNRQYVGFELNPEYIRIAKNRIQKELGILA